MIQRPVRWGRNRLAVTELKGLDAAHNFVHVATYASWVVDSQHQFVLRVDDKDGSNGQGESLFVGRPRVNHTVGSGDAAVDVRNDGKLDFNRGVALSDDIMKPRIVRLDGVDRESRNQTFHRDDLVVLGSEAANFRRADRRKVGWMRKENCPLAFFPLVKGIHPTLRRVGRKVRYNVSKVNDCDNSFQQIQNGEMR